MIAAFGPRVAQSDEKFERFEHGRELNHKMRAGSLSLCLRGQPMSTQCGRDALHRRRIATYEGLLLEGALLASDVFLLQVLDVLGVTDQFGYRPYG